MPTLSIPSPSNGVWYLGPVPLRAYALCIMLGVIVAVWMGERRWRARGGVPGTILDLAIWAVPFGLVGGRVYHVITDWRLYFGSEAPNRPIEALFIWNGGLGIWGAIALGGVGVWIGCRRRGISLSAVADSIAPGIAVAQAIGRWGNYFNQELFGGPTDLPWGLEIDPGRPGTIPGEDTYHPTFLYESIWDLGLAFVLIYIGRRFGFRHGRLFALYVAGYTLGRFWIEGLRVDPVGGVDHAVEFLGLRLNQWTSIAVFVGAVLYFWLTRNKEGEETIVAPAEGDGDDADPAHGAGQADGSESAAVAGAAAAPADEDPPAEEKAASKPAEGETATAEPAEKRAPEKAESGAEEPAANKPDSSAIPSVVPGAATAPGMDDDDGEDDAEGAHDPAHTAGQADDEEVVLAATESEARGK